jgi:hypothetical protein
MSMTTGWDKMKMEGMVHVIEAIPLTWHFDAYHKTVVELIFRYLDSDRQGEIPFEQYQAWFAVLTVIHPLLTVSKGTQIITADTTTMTNSVAEYCHLSLSSSDWLWKRLKKSSQRMIPLNVRKCEPFVFSASYRVLCCLSHSAYCWQKTAATREPTPFQSIRPIPSSRQTLSISTVNKGTKEMTALGRG